MRVRIAGRSITIPDTVQAKNVVVGPRLKPCKSVTTVASTTPTYDSVQSFFVPGPLPGMNDFISTGSRFIYNAQKKKWQDMIAGAIARHGLGPMSSAWFRFHWREQNKRRNPDNFAAIGKKFIFDALVRAGIFENDGWDQILGWQDQWSVDADNPGVYVEMLALMQEADPWK